MDFALPTGTKVQTPVSGTVVKCKSLQSSYGNYIAIRDSEGNTHYFAHLSGFNNIKVGQKVNAGDLIGYSGSTGNSTGPHLHYEVRKGDDYGNQINPNNYLK